MLLLTPMSLKKCVPDANKTIVSEHFDVSSVKSKGMQMCMHMSICNLLENHFYQMTLLWMKLHVNIHTDTKVIQNTPSFHLKTSTITFFRFCSAEDNISKCIMQQIMQGI